VNVPCNLREIRGKRVLRHVAEEAGINPGVLSQIERGRMLPRDSQLEQLEAVYGAPVEAWYPPRVLLAIEFEHGVDA
jgi:transcriptional regulator with XRE-family HTH domain